MVDGVMQRFEEGPRPWLRGASCQGVDADLFFPPRGAPAKEAKALCGRCPVRQECLDYALDHGERFGIWGGMSERQRRRIRRSTVMLRRPA